MSNKVSLRSSIWLNGKTIFSCTMKLCSSIVRDCPQTTIVSCRSTLHSVSLFEFCLMSVSQSCSFKKKFLLILSKKSTLCSSRAKLKGRCGYKNRIYAWQVCAKYACWYVTVARYNGKLLKSTVFWRAWKIRKSWCCVTSHLNSFISKNWLSMKRGICWKVRTIIILTFMWKWNSH